MTWRGEARLFDDIGFDTGFVPGGSPVSIRVAFGLLSRTTVKYMTSDHLGDAKGAGGVALLPGMGFGLATICLHVDRPG